MIADLAAASKRKVVLIDLSLWALTTGRSWLVQTVHRALMQEDLTHA